MSTQPELLAALKNVRAIISEGALTGFNCHDGDWAERLFASQQMTSAAIKSVEPGPVRDAQQTRGCDPVAYASAEQIAEIVDKNDKFGVDIPLRKTPAGLFQMPLYANPAAQCAPQLSGAWSAIKHDEIIKRLMADIGHPNSMSVYQAFKQFANELHALAAPPAVSCAAREALEALRLLAAYDDRLQKLHDLLETIREQIRLGVEPDHQPDGLFQNIQDAVYAMRGRTLLMNDAAITGPLNAIATALPAAGGEASKREAEIAERCAKIAYRVCAETRHVTLGDKAAAAIRASLRKDG
ncbi:MAG: hypothetical protein V4477_17070 [Pseudomonadota bacterium]